jgi:hypothetical protein
MVVLSFLSKPKQEETKENEHADGTWTRAAEGRD